MVFIISGPAGSGKGTVVSEIIGRNDGYMCAVSATSRPILKGEVNGVNYHYITREEFLSRIDSGDMLEYTEYCGNFYGTPLKEAEEVMQSGKNLILEIEVEGARNVKAKYPDAVLVLLLPPSYYEQEARLRGRATETEEKIRERLEQTRTEATLFHKYDYIVYNRDHAVEEAVESIRAIVRAEQLRTLRNPDAEKNYFAN